MNNLFNLCNMWTFIFAVDRSRLVQQLLGQQYNELSEREVFLVFLFSCLFFFILVVGRGSAGILSDK